MNVDDYDRRVLEMRRVELAEHGISVTWGGGACPVQIEGLVGGSHSFYFRSRGQRWSIEIASLRDGSVVFSTAEPYGEGPFDAGWMPIDYAIDLLIRSVKAFKKRKT